ASLGAAAYSLATPTVLPRPRRGRRVLTFRATASSGAGAGAGAVLDRRRRPQNVAGDFVVDQRCIDCQTCRWMAPEVFKRVDGKAAVATQPSTEEERTKALQALLSCPTSSIHTEKPPKDILQVQNMFPLPIDDKLLPRAMERASLRGVGTKYSQCYPRRCAIVSGPEEHLHKSPASTVVLRGVLTEETNCTTREGEAATTK
ncbi:uncharacterized protein, partial [Miscanthus floridulus]|uniref:uncharacterized protein n=1 Tax=Miscanthus floridulus TaxID=154761 RepID=UPI00345A0E94